MNPPTFPFHLVPWWQWVLVALSVCICMQIFIMELYETRVPGDYGLVMVFVLLATFVMLLLAVLNHINRANSNWQPYFDEQAKFEQYSENYRIAKEQVLQAQKQKQNEWIHERMKQL